MLLHVFVNHNVQIIVKLYNVFSKKDPKYDKKIQNTILQIPNIVEKTRNAIFRETKYLRSYMGHIKAEKSIYPIQYNQIQYI